MKKALITALIILFALGAEGGTHVKAEGETNENVINETIEESTENNVGQTIDPLVRYKDSQVYASINISLGNSADHKLTIEELENITSLDLSRSGVTDLDLLSYCTNLVSLDLSSNYVYNIEPLKTLIKLEELNLSDTGVIDFDPLLSLPNLKTLDISSNYVYRDEFLTGNEIYKETISKLPAIENLYASNMNMYDIDFLKNCTTLKVIDLSNNKIKDISVLKDLAKGGTLKSITVKDQYINIKSIDCKGKNKITFVNNITPFSKETFKISGDNTSYDYNNNEITITNLTEYKNYHQFQYLFEDKGNIENSTYEFSGKISQEIRGIVDLPTSAPNNEPIPTKTNLSSKGKVPKTGDAGVVAIVNMALASLGGALYLGKKMK